MARLLSAVRVWLYLQYLGGTSVVFFISSAGAMACYSSSGVTTSSLVQAVMLLWRVSYDFTPFFCFVFALPLQGVGSLQEHP